MKNVSYIKQAVFVLIILAMPLSSQSLKLFGKYNPGSCIIGHCDSLQSITLNGTNIPFDSAGFFLFGFDRDDKGTYHLIVKFTSGKSEIKKISLNKRVYDVQRIDNMKKKYVSPPKSELARINKERRIIKKAELQMGNVDNALYSRGFVIPLKGGRKTGVFGSQRVLNGVPKDPHNGIDLASPTGTPVYSMTDAKVLMTSDNFYYRGNFILLDHGHGLNSKYLHLSKIFVEEGDFVKKGQLIGEVGSTGRSTGPHLHWGVQWFEKRIDPESLLELDKLLKDKL